MRLWQHRFGGICGSSRVANTERERAETRYLGRWLASVHRHDAPAQQKRLTQVRCRCYGAGLKSTDIPMRHKLTLDPEKLALYVFFAVSLAFGVPASAATPAEELIKQGLDLRRAGRDMDALAKFESAYGLAKSPRAAAQWGLCLQAVSRWSEAEPLLSEALSSPNEPWVKKNRETLKDSLEVVKTHVGRLQLSGDPAGATIRVGGNVVGTFPLPSAVTVTKASST